MSDFVHLHCHTEYSLLDGAIKIKDLCQKTVDFGLSAVTITDHGNLFGALNFYSKAKEFGLKPIVGCEVYVAPKHRKLKDARSASEAGYHLVLLAQNNQGYQNLIKLVSAGFLEGFYYKPRVDKELLAQWSSGLIALSACLKGEIPFFLMKNDFDSARKSLDEYLAMFPDRFYLELQANGIPQQEELNQKLLELAEDRQLPIVATNDCHYLTAQDAEAHDVLLCIQTNSCVTDKNRMRFNTDKLYYRPPQEMTQAFSHCPQAIENTKKIADCCNLEIELGQHHFPVYKVQQGQNLEEEFRQMAQQGLQKRLQETNYQIEESIYWDRLQEELEIICKKGFAGYFLIVQDFINWSKSQGIPVGPGRGSAAGSLVAYCLKITNLDPIRYGLLFERFLNVERESLPDIDVDFCYNRREEVIRYVTQKYGHDNVAQITTFGTMKARAAVRDVGRALGMSFSETDKIAKLIPEEPKMTIDKALKQEPDLAKKAKQEENIGQLIDISKRLEGLARHASTHAAGIVISDKPMEEYLPLYLGKKGEVVTQYDMKQVEKVGLIKFDFLGLKTLTVINDTLKLAQENNKEIPDLDKLPLDDSQTFDLLCKGQTNGVFQLESSGMRNVLTELKPNCFEDVIALLALYRPGPLESGMVTDFIQRKHGEKEVEYPHPWLEPILKQTYGVILYQEQVMQIASKLANYSLGDGDILRRAMGKKDPAVMAKQRNKFLEGAKENDLKPETANYIFDLIEKFAGYGFNKSHSAAYALISYQTAYLKTHYPLEFMAALITSEVNNTDKVISHINACREEGIQVKMPDINKSKYPFTVEDDSLRYGLSGIKNVGEKAIQEIIKEREKNGPFKSLMDFCQRLRSAKLSKKVLESLIKSGAMDCFQVPRAALMACLNKTISNAQKKSREKKTGQLSLLSFVQKEPQKKASEPQGIGLDIPEAKTPEWSEEERLKKEKENLGFFLSGHPLLRFQNKMRLLQTNTLQQCNELTADSEAKLALLVTGNKEISTRKGDKMAFCQVEDLTGTAELVLFPDNYKQIKDHLELDQPLFCTAKINKTGNEENSNEEKSKQLKLVAQSVQLLSQVSPPEDQPCQLRLNAQNIQDHTWTELKDILSRYPGSTPVQLVLYLDQAVCKLQLGPDFSVDALSAMEEIEKWQTRIN